MQQDPLKIKKYANRRLYDTEQSRYITLAELADIVRGGRVVEVCDAKSGDDLTRQVLVQVILEEQERLDLLPPELLHNIIRVQGTVEAGALSSWLRESTAQFRQMGDKWSRQVDTAFEGAAGAVREGAKLWMDMVGNIFSEPPSDGGATGSDDPSASDEPPGDSPPTDEERPSGRASGLADDVAALKDQMAELMRRITDTGE